MPAVIYASLEAGAHQNQGNLCRKNKALMFSSAEAQRRGLVQQILFDELDGRIELEIAI
jgi:hypothetical protein